MKTASRSEPYEASTENEEMQGLNTKFAVCRDSWYVSSDYRSLVGLVEEYITLEDGDMFCIENGDCKIVNH